MSPLSKLSRHHRFVRREAGLSIIELMISIVLGLMVLTAVISVFVNASASRAELERTSRQIENGRFAIELLSDDVRLAGFIGEMDGSALPGAGALADVEHNPCSTTAAHWGKAMNFHVLGYDDAAGVPACVPADVKAGTDVMVVRRAKSCVAGVAGCEAATAGKPYLQVSMCDTEMATAPYVIGLQGTAAYTLKLRDCATTSGRRQYLVHIYYISTDNGAGQQIPTLKMLELTGGSMVVTPLVEGIEELNIEYGIDTNGDGTVDAYTPDPSAYACGGCTPESNWRNVVTVQFHLLARNIDVSPGYSDGKIYTLGRDAAGNPVTRGPFKDGFRRHLYSGLVRVANIVGRRDTP